MLNIGEFRNEENGLLSLPTSTDSRLPQFCLTLNCGEKPRIPNPTKLSQILEQNVDTKYNLSAKACQGILNRAARRGKELPKALLDALTEQAAMESISKVEKAEQTSQQEFPQPLQEIATELHTLSPSKNEPGATGGARESSFRTSGQEPCQPSITNPSSPNAFGISSLDSNAMKSPNPHSGIYEADTSRTLDLNGGNPACNQGGVAVVASIEGNGARPSHQGNGWGGL